LAQQCEEADQPEAADWYEQALRVEPRAEDVYRRLMNVYSRLGRSADAVETYRRCRAAVADHLGAKPSPETEALLQAVRLR
jgi:DNA-binding SARP family transcriptional activator